VKRAGEKKRRKINNHRKIFENLGELKKVNSRKGGPNKKGKRRRKGSGGSSKNGLIQNGCHIGLKLKYNLICNVSM